MIEKWSNKLQCGNNSQDMPILVVFVNYYLSIPHEMDISSWQNIISMSENFQMNIKTMNEKTIKFHIFINICNIQIELKCFYTIIFCVFMLISMIRNKLYPSKALHTLYITHKYVSKPFVFFLNSHSYTYFGKQ